MRIWLVCRHQGTREWAATQGVVATDVVAHLDVELVHPGDVVVGTLPVHIAASLRERGAQYVHLRIDTPPESRGRELSSQEMTALHARLEVFEVTRAGAFDVASLRK